MADPRREIEFRWVPIDLIVPNSWNINQEDQTTFERLQDEIAEVGFIDPLEVVQLEDETYRIIGGEHRWKAATNLGYQELPVVVLTDAKWADQDVQKLISVRVNFLKGRPDPDKFAVLYKEFAAKYGAESVQRLFGMTDQKAFQKLVDHVNKGLKASLPKEMGGQVDKATGEARSLEDLADIIQNLFQQYGASLAQSYMVFTYGSQKHLYVKMNAKMRRAMDKVLEACRVTGQDVNEFLLKPIEQASKNAGIEMERKKQQEVVDGVDSKKNDW